MLYRMKQFFHALFPKISEDDLLWVNRILGPNEVELFKKLPVHEQQHSIAVGKDCMRANGSEELLKAALLHDIGKIESNLTILNKSLVVLLSPFEKHKKHMARFIRDAFYYKEYHPLIGANLLKNIYIEINQGESFSLTPSQERVIELIEAHHHGNDSRDNELQLLKKSDANN